MSDWKIIIPEATTNLVTNPSFETNTTSWSTGGTNTIAQSTDAKFFGSNSLKCTYADDDTLASYAVTLTAVAYIASAYVYIPSNYDGTQLQLQWLNFTSATVANGSLDMTITDAWQRVTATITPDAGDLSGDLVLYENGTAPTATRFVYIDGVQIEAKTYATTYCDGTQAGCSWTGTAHASTSTRLATEHSGGKIADFYDDYSFKVKAYPGTGVPPVVNQSTPYALQDGSLFKGLRYSDRVFTLVGAFVGTSTSDLHTKRQALIKALSSRTGGISGANTITIRYTGATVTKQIACVYDAGLELGMFANGIENDVPLRFVAFDPAWRAINSTNVTLSANSAETDDYFISKVNEVWDTLDSALNAEAYALGIAPNGNIYIGGDFTSVEGGSITRIAYWDGISWNAMGTGLNDYPLAIAFDSVGDVYVGGNFTLAGGVANTAYIAKWTGGAWTALGTGLNGTCYDIAIDSTDNVYITGSFTSAGGVANTTHVAMWNGSAWTPLSTGLGAAGYCLAVDSADDVYVGGAFTTAGGVSANYIAKWNGSAFSALGSGLNNNPWRFTLANNDDLYVGGNFTTAGGATANYIAYWSVSGSAWATLGAGLSAQAFAVAFDSNGIFYAGGDFTTAGTITANYIARWTGSAWSALSVQFNGRVAKFDIDSNDNYYMVGAFTNPSVSGQTTIAYVGTEISYPVITINRSGGTTATLISITNSTTQAVLKFNDFSLQDGETITIDLRPGSRAVTSSRRGLVWTALADDSDIASFYLQPDNTTGTSDNVISAYVYTTGSPTITATLTYTATYRSLD